MKSLKIPQTYQSVVEKLIKIAKDNNFIIYAVGGFVRDIILKREPNDLDIMVEGENAGIEFSKIVAAELNIHPPITFEKFATSKLIIEDKEIEFIMPRKEYYDKNSRNPQTEIGTLEQDALRRDFTVNALFLKLNDFELLDLTKNGLQDIEAKIIRVTDESASDIIFEQDPLRILRAVRQAFQLNFKIEPKTYQSMKNKVGRITIVSGERIAEEINKILLLEKPSKAFDMLDDIGLLGILFPELKQTQNVLQPKPYHDKDVYNHTMDVVDKIKPDLLLRMAALFHDVGKPETRAVNGDKISFINHETVSSELTKQILVRLKYPMDFIKKVCFLIQNHMYPKMYNSDWKDSAVRRFANKMGDNTENIRLLNIADDKTFKNELFDRVELLKQKKMLMPEEELFNGNELIEIFNKPAGKWINDVKEHIRNLQFENPKITKEEVLKKLKNLLKIQ
ncbi:MAG: HD domain-containing protein [Elusimicrobia bacterium]|nr:HD domain-containing protein [Elusimicrobiota bacterium]